MSALDHDEPRAALDYQTPPPPLAREVHWSASVIGAIVCLLAIFAAVALVIRLFTWLLSPDVS